MMETGQIDLRKRITTEFLLVRMMSPSRQPPGPKQVRESLSSLLGCSLSEDVLEPIRKQLVDEGYLFRTPRRAYRLTEAGRHRALSFLGLKTLPRRCHWRTVLTKYLPAALIRHWEQDLAKMQNQHNTALPPTLTSYKPTPFPVPRDDSGTPHSIDLPAFAQAVLQHASSLPSHERFGPNKAFIACVWQAMQANSTFPPMNLDTFKQFLIAAHRQGLLCLSRADLVQAMNPQWLSQSRTQYLSSEFHFILIPDSHTLGRR